MVSLPVQPVGTPSAVHACVHTPPPDLDPGAVDDDEMARLFSYDPTRGTYEMLGMIDVNRRPFFTWQAYVVDAMAIGANDTIYMGQSERKSKLYLYFPEPTGNAFSCEEGAE